MLESLGGIAGENVVDLYAGSGSFGIESLSRGASHATFVEQDREAQTVLAKNLDTLGFAERASIVNRPVERVVATLDSFAVAFCDPPYAKDPWPFIFETVDAELLVGHSESPIELASGWEELKRRKYGRSHILIARPLTSLDS